MTRAGTNCSHPMERSRDWITGAKWAGTKRVWLDWESPAQYLCELACLRNNPALDSLEYSGWQIPGVKSLVIKINTQTKCSESERWFYLWPCRNYEFLSFISYSVLDFPKKTCSNFSCFSIFLWFEDKYICPQGALKHRAAWRHLRS